MYSRQYQDGSSFCTKNRIKRLNLKPQPIHLMISYSVICMVYIYIYIAWGGVLPYSLGGGVPLGSRKSYPLIDQILQILWPLYQTKNAHNCSWFQSFVSDPVKRDPILDQFSMITRPYTRPNGLKTIPFPAAHTRIANIWEYPPGIYCTY